MSCTENSDCNMHGICNETCICYESYSGDLCQNCLDEEYARGSDGYCVFTCNTDYDCYYDYFCQLDPILKINLCACETLNADPDRDCLYCIDGFHATADYTCEPISCVKDRKLCSDSGSCIQTDGIFSCQCKSDFTGTFCENCLNNLIKTNDGQCLPEECVDSASNECSGQGVCDVSQKDCICEHGYAGRTCQNCNIGYKEYDVYYGKVCLPEICFFGDEKEPCSANGNCIREGTENYCDCKYGSAGSQCQDCAIGYEKLDDGYCLPAVCEVNSKDCDNHGYCIESKGDYICYCYEDFDVDTKCSTCKKGFSYVYVYCISDTCVINDTECSDHGYCLLEDFANEIYECVCEYGYTGKLCNECDTANGYISVDRGACVQPECIANNAECSNNGSCYKYSTGWKCSCNSSATGDKCENCGRDYVVAKDGQCVLEDCYSGQLECGGHGYCSYFTEEHYCICDENFTTESRCVECVPGLTLKDGICTPGGNKLSGGAIAGIIIAILILLTAICLGVWFGLKGKKAKISNNTVPKDSDFGGQAKLGSQIGSGSGNFN